MNLFIIKISVDLNFTFPQPKRVFLTELSTVSHNLY